MVLGVYNLFLLSIGVIGMSISLKTFLDGKIPQNEMDLAEISDRLWQIGTLTEIKEKVCPELFVIHIGVNMIGIWKGDGWGSVISENAVLVPYIPSNLETLNLQDLKAAFERVISVFPDFVVFENDTAAYVDAINFLQNARFRISDERLLKYNKEERAQMSRSYQDYLNELEKLTEPLWGYNAPDEGWGDMLKYIHAHIIFW